MAAESIGGGGGGEDALAEVLGASEPWVVGWGRAGVENDNGVIAAD